MCFQHTWLWSCTYRYRLVCTCTICMGWNILVHISTCWFVPGRYIQNTLFLYRQSWLQMRVRWLCVWCMIWLGLSLWPTMMIWLLYLHCRPGKSWLTVLTSNHMPLIYQAHSLNVHGISKAYHHKKGTEQTHLYRLGISKGYAWHLHIQAICMVYTRYIHGICLVYIVYIHGIYLAYTLYNTRICNAYALHIHSICSEYTIYIMCIYSTRQLMLWRRTGCWKTLS